MVESMLIISTNIGSHFEDGNKIFFSWAKALKEHIKSKNSQFVVITMQEFGGKNVVPLVESNQFLKNTYEYFKEDFPIFLSAVDCDLNNEKCHTALCTIYMAKNGFESIEIFNFEDNQYQLLKEGFHVHHVSFESQTSIKIKFDIELFPEKKWSRKGYLINRIRLSQNHVFDIVNLHLIHDCNFQTLVEHPKIYQNFRSMQLKAVINKLVEIKSERTVLCGDFNFRTSLVDMVQNSEPMCVIEKEKRHHSSESLFTVKDKDQHQTIASISAKDMQLTDNLLPLDAERLERHKKFDKELIEFDEILVEPPIYFMPTYCFTVDSDPRNYNKRRFPSWCDRIVFRGDFAALIKKNIDKLKYESVGHELIMGDHKPVSVEIPLYLIKNLPQ